jgi:hypothetical protein
VARDPYTPPTSNVSAIAAPEHSPRRWWRYVVFALLAAPFLLVAACVGYIRYDIANVGSACAALKPGVAMADARSILAEHGLDKYAPDANSKFSNGVPANAPGLWFFAIPAAATMGDFSCGVTHDGHSVVKAEASGA